MPRCFVIQPFDNGPYDRRFEDTFAPAIRDAGLEPYRVDRDPTVSIPIEEIENAISEADVCFAEISTDNPNVWFELGFSLSRKKDICIVCSTERQSKFPFDIQHRSIIRYDTSSLSDFETLRENIKKRILGIIEKQKTLVTLSAQSPIRDTEGLSEHEIVTLCTVMENRSGPESGASFYQVSQDMEKMGYNNLAVNIGIERLVSKRHLSHTEVFDINGEVYSTYIVTETGICWLLENEDKLNLRKPAYSANTLPSKAITEDDIPF